MQMRTNYLDRKVIKKDSSKLVISFIYFRYIYRNNKNEKSLNTWISTNRKKYKNKKLSNDKITKLETLKNFQWNAIKETWISNFNQLKLYIDDNKGYPNKYSKIENEKSLGLWVYTNKQNYKNNKLSNDKIEKLKTLKNWIWKGKLKKKTKIKIKLIIIK